jgi:riboflavin biosynthesis pyrimidine reductase
LRPSKSDSRPPRSEQALRHRIVDGLAAFDQQDHDRLLERITLAFRTRRCTLGCGSSRPASLSLNWAMMAAGLVDRLQVTIFPVISGRTGISPILGGAGDFDLELLESRTLDGHTQELVYRPTRR